MYLRVKIQLVNLEVTTSSSDAAEASGTTSRLRCITRRVIYSYRVKKKCRHARYQMNKRTCVGSSGCVVDLLFVGTDAYQW